jgi:hypothetical protein
MKFMARLLDDAAVHDEEDVGERHGLDLVVGHVDARGVEPVVELSNVDADLRTEGGVEVRERLVEEEELRAADDGAAHGDALALPAGEGFREAVEERPEAEHLGGLVDALRDLGLVCLAELEPEAEVLAHGEVRVKGVRLEDHGDVAVARLEPRDLAVAEMDRPGVGHLEPREEAQERRLPAPARSDEDRERPLGDLDGDALEDLCIAKPLRELLDAYGGHRNTLL